MGHYFGADDSDKERPALIDRITSISQAINVAWLDQD
jgi:hypothetical protein